MSFKITINLIKKVKSQSKPYVRTFIVYYDVDYFNIGHVKVLKKVYFFDNLSDSILLFLRLFFYKSF